MARIDNSHARPAAFRRLLRGLPAAPAEVQTIVRHLLGGCETCRERMAAARDAGGDPETWSYDGVFSRLARRAGPERDNERDHEMVTVRYTERPLSRTL